MLDNAGLKNEKREANDFSPQSSCAMAGLVPAIYVFQN
jgi:hypothetical protein